MEERRQQREQEEAKRREEEAEEERRVALEREMLKRRYELDTLKERQKVRTQHTHRQCAKVFTTDQEFSPQSHFWSTSVAQEQQNHQPEQPKQGHNDGRHQETTEPTGEQTETP